MGHPSYLAVWIGTREVVLFGIGVFLILHSVIGNGAIDRVIELTVGLILVGIVPADVMLRRFLGNGRPPAPPPIEPPP